jgi:hypothetical protein
VEDPTGVPSQILGSIEAPGQVYVINRNGIVFGGSSQVNTRGFVASTLPINDNLIGRGLLNNPDSQFLFSAVPLPAGKNGTVAFNPIISDAPFTVAAGAESYTLQETVAVNGTNVPLRAPEFSFQATDGSKTNLVAGTDYTLAVDPATKRATVTFNATGLAKIGSATVTVIYTPTAVKSGDVVVKAGAKLASRTGGDGNGGRVMLVGANVKNQGTISTTSGQTILAAGQQVGVAAHAGDDPSLRGLDVWVGAAAPGTGTAVNSGMITSLTGNISISGREVFQLGILESSTSVNLNGRIDLSASYGAVSNPNTNAGQTKPPFLFQHTGLLTFGEDSVTRILPEYASDRTIPGTSLSEKSQINVTGKSVHFAGAATVFAPNADVKVRAGDWPYADADGNGTTLNALGELELGVTTHFVGVEQRFLFSSGQIYLDPSATINVAGSTDVFVPLVQSILDVELRGSELADAPLQRDGLLRAAGLTIDIRQTGVTRDGRYWVGTPLGDATGLAGLVERNIAQLTADGGSVSLQAGTSIVLRDGATIDVSGGTYRYEAGMVQTSRLMQFGRLVEIADAQPDQIYDGIFTGQFTNTSARWGVSETFSVPWMLGEHFEESTIGGARGGSVALTAPSMAIDGELLGMTVEGPRQRTTGVDLSSLSIDFKGERLFGGSATQLTIIQFSPTPPSIVLSPKTGATAPGAFSFSEDAVAALPNSRIDSVALSPDLLTTQGFGHLSVGNVDGDITVPRTVAVTALPRGSVSLAGANVSVLGSLSAPGGSLSFRTFNLSPSFVEEFNLEFGATRPDPAPNADRGRFTLASGAVLDTSGLLVDDRPSADAPLSQTLAIDGGSISISTYSADLAKGGIIDVSGGLRLGTDGRVTYGDGGSIDIRTGKDLSLGSVTGGTIKLASTLRGYSGAVGGSLSIQAQLIQIGGTAEFPNTLLLGPGFFQRGGFTEYSLTGLGADSLEPVEPGEPETYAPAVRIAPGTVIRPVADSILLVPGEFGSGEIALQRVRLEVGERAPVSIKFGALGYDDDFTTDVLEARGDIVIGAGSRIVTDPGASITLDGQTVTVFGSLIAPGGTIAIKGAEFFPLPRAIASSFAQPTVHIASHAILSTAGISVLLPDEFGRQTGTLYDGGVISVYGNIVAEAGAVLNASGASAEFDMHPSMLGIASEQVVSPASGLTEPLWKLKSTPVRMDSNGGLIELEGAQMLLSDATLIGRAGGPTALGGALSVFSGRFYGRNNGIFTTDIANTDINLVVTQSGNVLPSSANIGIGQQIFDNAGAAVPGLGYFAIDRFTRGGFDSLDLGAKFLESSNTSSLAFGGNIQFKGDVTINVPGTLRMAGGGVIQADGKVAINAPYVVVGQPFRPPLNPDDPIVTFQQDTVSGSPVDYAFAPTFGTGNLVFNSRLIDLGNLSLQTIGRAAFNAGGDIRGNGTVAIRGDLTLRASQIYPTTLATLNFFAYDPVDGTGSVTIRGGGSPATPLSAGGSLNIFATNISQGGLLRAPLGTINLGWDGTDFDPSDTDLDKPFDPLTRGALASPIASQVTLQQGSMTSVSAVDWASGTGIVLPFGISPDGFSWIDPRGVNVTASGLPEKHIEIAGVSVSTKPGSKIDLRGGGELFGFRWVPGIGGSRDLLGSAGGEWSSSVDYTAGDLVTFRGATYAARVDSKGQRPKEGLFWSRVEESYAVVPGFAANFAPYNTFNTTSAELLQGERGYIFTPSVTGDRIFSSLSEVARTYDRVAVGNQITLSSVAGLDAGVYTLLPRRYALYPGAYLVTPRSGAPIGSIELPTGASYAQGQRVNAFNLPDQTPLIQSRFEVAPPDVVQGRAEYDSFFGNNFFSEAARRLEVQNPQRLPMDAGYLAFQGNEGFSLKGGVLTTYQQGGKGAQIDISSFANIHLIGGTGTAPTGEQAVLTVGRIDSWNAESVLIGGIRRQTATGTVVDVRTTSLTLNNPGDQLLGWDITLAARTSLNVADGSAIASKGTMSTAADAYTLGNNGALLRVSADPRATISRTGTPDSTAALLSVGADTTIGGRNVLLDSTYGTSLDPTLDIKARNLTMGSGQISIILDEQSHDLVGGVVDPQLVLTGALLTEVQQVSSLTLRSYRTIDMYGAGTFGGDEIGSLRFLAGGLRGYDQGTGIASFTAESIAFDNPSKTGALSAPGTLSGTLEFNAGRVFLGSNNFSVTGFENLQIAATEGVLGRATNTTPGAFSTLGNLTIEAPVITGMRGSKHAITAGGALILADAGGEASVSGGLGSSFTFTGTTVASNSNVILPSGEIILRALNGDVTVGGKLDASGAQREFYDLIRYSDAGRVLLTSDTGNVTLQDGSVISVESAGLGKAGTVGISAINGAFANAGSLRGGAKEDARSGTFLLDVKSIGDYASINDPLQTGGFFNERNLRIRTGSIVIDGTTRARNFTLSADAGPIVVTGTIDASGKAGAATGEDRTGGKIALVSGGSLTLEAESLLTVHAADFSSSGKGGAVRLEAGAAINGTANTSAMLDLKAGSTIDLGVDAYVAGNYNDPGSSAFRGQFQGTLHLRAPRAGNDIQISTLAGDIVGASSILAEGFRVYDRTGQVTLDTSLLATIHADSQAYMNAGYAAMSAKLLGGNADLTDLLVIAPGVELINTTGDLILGTDADNAANDWNLATMRYGPKQAPGVLTIRAAGNLQFKNALSDGFAGEFSPNDFGEVPTPGQELWLRPVMDIVSTLPVNTQSWSYRLVAGSDFSAADLRRLKPLETLNGSGLLSVGKFYPANLVSGPDATTASAIDNRYQVVRTGTGNIDIAAAGDVQLRNQFASIYTAGVRLPYSNSIFGEAEVRLMSIFALNDFAVPLVELSTSHPSQGSLLGAFQQAYAAQYTMAGGDVSVFAQGDIARVTEFNGVIRPDSARQLPNNWLYRRGFVDPATGLFAEGGVGPLGDRSASTTWWVDFSNFFQGFGALGGGDVSLLAGRNIINADAVSATNARMSGRDAATGLNLAPDPARLLELGGGDVTIRAGNNIDGGIYYAERGSGSLFAGGSIKTNESRSPSPGLLQPISGTPDVIQSTFPAVLDPLTWLPTTLFVGKSEFDVSAAGDILLGPVTNPFLLPQGNNNKFWYKTYFDTYSADAGVSVASFGGSVTHRLAVTLPGSTSLVPILQAWLEKQNLLGSQNSSFYEPWIRLAEASVANFATITTVGAPTLHSTAFAGDLNIVGSLNLFPSPRGTLELAASGGIVGLQPSGKTLAFLDGQFRPVTLWTSAAVNLSDADPSSLPGPTSPVAYRLFAPNIETALAASQANQFANITPSFEETGSFAGENASIETQQALHGRGVLHANDRDPVRLYALGGDISGFTLFSPKAAQIVADNDITDVAFYIQNTSPGDVSLVSAGRDVIAFNENYSLRSIAGDLARGNIIDAAKLQRTVTGINTSALEGDIQISGPGVLEVLSGRTLDLGSGANLPDGTGVGIVSIGNFRNPNLPFEGADIIAMTSISGNEGGPAFGLSGSTLDFTGFIRKYLSGGAEIPSSYLSTLGKGTEFRELNDEQQAIVALEKFYLVLRDAGRSATAPDSAAAASDSEGGPDSTQSGAAADGATATGVSDTTGYDAGYAAIDLLFGTRKPQGEIFTHARDIRTSTGGSISISVPGGGLTMASDIFGNPLTPPGIVTEFGGAVSVFTDGDVDLGQARIFTLRGGDIMMWSSNGDIAAGTAPKTVVTAPPTRVVLDATSADIKTDLGGLATGGGIGVLAAVEGVEAGNVDLIAPKGIVDAGDAGIRVTGNLNIAAVTVLNASNIQSGGASSGVPAPPPPPAPNLGAVTANNANVANNSAANELANKRRDEEDEEKEEAASIIIVEVIGYGGGEGT